MKVVMFIGYLCFLLMGGVHNFYVDTPHSPTAFTSTQNFTDNLQLKFTIKDQSNIVIEDTDFDLEEEHLNTDEVKDGQENKLLSGNYSWIDKQFLALSCPFLLNHYYKSAVTSPPFYGPCTPIYIKNRVLRI